MPARTGPVLLSFLLVRSSLVSAIPSVELLLLFLLSKALLQTLLVSLSVNVDIGFPSGISTITPESGG